MRLGYFAMPLHPPGSDPARTMEEDLVIGHEWQPRAGWLRSMTLLRDQVLPQLARHG
jgi:hypothetical protein